MVPELNPKAILDLILRLVILFSLGTIAVIVTSSVFMFFFVPIVGAYLWDNHDKIKALEARISQLEKPAEETKPEQT